MPVAIFEVSTPTYPEPLQPTGVLEPFKFEDATPVIGREYPELNPVDDVLRAKNSSELIRDLAITISQRGVVFFRAQDNLTDDLQKELILKLGELSGRPAESTLHFGPSDKQISSISSAANNYINRNVKKDRVDRRGGASTWHSDIQFEPTPADYTSLRLAELPPNGGDTIDPYRKFLEGLTATFKGQGFVKAAEANPDKYKILEGPRGHPENIGRVLKTVHPIVRTNPVTGWKSIFAVGPFLTRINELSARESKELSKLLYRRILENHDLQVRFKWRNKNDFATWDNCSVFHSATDDYDELRVGHRVVGIGEKPYFDPESKSRNE
ncbi:hypothetical protein B0I35DRAFT_455103 [Stachybotrys elegans]|uniref:TauD/TfdA-like domain-containing protein n=1 Tax=Stachybotrys elegans TaxID=80388 RepID=A0A8K0WIY8_9HYPO|nr:hypothetical protein B0I35DRAFT_455103 [Stachybotrys elegans]